MILILFILVTLSSLPGFSQNTNINGVINTYAWGIKIINPTQIQVDDVTGFSVNDTILIIQMQGAQIITSNSPNFGTVTNFGNTGNYEFSIINNINSSAKILSISCPLQHTYADSLFQVVKVKTYFNATVNNTLTCMPWNGKKGGVLAMFVYGTLTLNANIDVSEKGFRGFQNTDQNNLNQCGFNSFFYSTHGKDSSGLKGEGIAVTLPQYARGRGKLANGGGGGNALNSAGGGGSNAGEGGIGGKEASSCFSSLNNGGLGGENLLLSNLYTGNRLFLGGGGGSGTFESYLNDNSKGGNGGGIILIIANKIEANNFALLANGESITYTTINESAGGGGGGGTILLKSNQIQGNISIQARGGNGGSSSNTNCRGSGGGGGGGLVYFNDHSGYITNVSGGLAGSACTNFKGTNGNSGIVLNNFLFNLGCLQNNINQIQANQIICYGQTPQQLTGSTSFDFVSYQWQYSYDNNNWLNCPGNSTQPHYQPGALTQTTFFRRIVTLLGGNISTSNTVAITINQYTLNIQKTDVLCYGNCNGSATVHVAPNTGPFIYVWSNGQNTQTISNLCASTYYVTVIDAFGCSAHSSINISEPPQLIINTTIQKPTCTYTCNGSILFVAQGGTPPYTYQTFNNQNPLTNLCAGNYGVTVTDNNSCTAQFMVNLTPTTVIQNNIISTNSPQNICPYNSIILTGTNPTGSGMFNFLWQTSLNGTSWSNAPPINYNPQYIWIADQSRYFRRIVTGGGCSDTSNVLFLTVVQINNNIQTADTSYCSYDSILPITGTQDSAYQYIWEYNNGNGWNILSTEIMPYTYPISSMPIASYRRIIHAYGCYDTSNIITIHIKSPINGNLIYIDDTVTIKQYCQIAEGNLIGITPFPNASFIWQYSLDSLTWTNLSGSTPSFHFSLSDYSIRFYYFRRILIIDECFDTSNVVIVDLLPPLLNLIETSQGLNSIVYVCQGSSLAIGSFINQPSGGNNQYNYLWLYRTNHQSSVWQPAPGINNQKNYFILSVLDTVFYARIITSGACTDTSNILSIYPIVLPPNEITSTKTEYCTGEEIGPITELQQTQNVQYQWQKFDNNNSQWINISGANQVSFIPPFILGTVSYKRIISINNCSLSSNIIDITCFSSTSASLILEGDDSLCYSPNLTANISVNIQGTSPWNITFSINGELMSSVQHQSDSVYSFPLAASQNFISIINIQSQNQCSTTVDPDTIIIWVFQSVSAQSFNSEACGLNANIQAIPPTQGIGTWYAPSNITIQNLHSPNTQIQSSTYGTFLLIWEIRNGACYDTSHTILNLYENPQPPHAGNDMILYDNLTPITLNASPPTAGQGTWSVVQGQANFSNIHHHNATVTNIAEGDNILRWTITNGVCPQLFDEIIIKLYSIIVPEGFSPNSDGKNDFFVIKGLDENLIVHLIVFNRWGNIVYENNKYKNDWDGKDKNGQHLPDDTYFFILNKDNKLMKSGYLILKR